jgi:hypothetical protein
MKLDLCFPSVIYLVLAVGSLLLTMVAPMTPLITVIPRVIIMGTMLVLMQVFCRYGYSRVSWFILFLMFFLPVILLLPLFVLPFIV